MAWFNLTCLFDSEVTQAYCYSCVYSNSWSWAPFSKLLTTRDLGLCKEHATARPSNFSGWLTDTLFSASMLHHHDLTTEPSQLTLAESQWCRVAPTLEDGTVESWRLRESAVLSETSFELRRLTLADTGAQQKQDITMASIAQFSNIFVIK